MPKAEASEAERIDTKARDSGTVESWFEDSVMLQAGSSGKGPTVLRYEIMGVVCNTLLTSDRGRIRTLENVTIPVAGSNFVP